MAERSIGRSSALLASGTIASRILGFLKAIVLLQAIGAFAAGDAFTAGNQLPNTIYVIVAGGALSAVLVPQIVRSALHTDGGTAYINKLVTISLLVLAVTALVATLLAPFLVSITAHGFSAEQTALATAFAYWCLPQIFFYGVYTILGEVLNARNSFGPFTLSPILNNIVALVGLIVFIAVFGADPDGTRPLDWWTPSSVALLAGTATLGIAVQGLILFAFWRRVGLVYRPDFGWKGVGLKQTGKIASWSFGMILVTTAAGLVETNVVSTASGGDSASIAALANAWLIFMLPHSVVAVSIATAYFTRMSENASAGDLGRVRADVSASIRQITVIMVLAGVVLFVVAYPFGRVMIDSIAGSTAIGTVLMAFLVGLPAFSILFVLQRAFFSLGDTRTPFYTTVFQAVVFSIGSLAVLLFVPKAWVGVGVALMLSLAGILQTIVAGVLIRRKLGGGIRRVATSFAKDALAALPASVAGAAVYFAFGGPDPAGYALSGRIPAIITMAVVAVVMTVLYAATLRLVRSSELSEAVTPILRRLRRS
ncbi:murein biosynthesis integral membrane protein MurJ [Subtercola frigoramans]|uniref:Peptidoglycan lipid II flippase n=1 Tax=Subtercola frigoramans TaxID=120298 RepID=A0ABS2L1P3_9MICO|nr:murein biosynthesis integral membrane protein MurJ [Subtercola frigoramans]MBM7470386.1 putative peptidoglycan lipid II flippase [Subtercola frigoramans]